MIVKKMFTTRVNPDLLKRLKHLSVEIETPISDLTEEAIEDLLKKKKAKKFEFNAYKSV